MMTPSSPFTPVRAFDVVVLHDERVTQRLLAELAPRIARVVRAVLGREHSDLEDVQQQALIALVQALPSFRGECEPRHFASRIAARTALTAARRSRVERARRDDGVEVDELLSGDAEPNGEAAPQRRRDILRELLTRIAPEQAEPLTLRVVLGWSLPEISEATGSPLNTVRSRIRLAKESLRRMIERHPGLAEALDVDRG